MNKQSNTYTIIYIVVVVLIVGTLLALTAMSLKDRQTANANADKMKQILASVHVDTEGADVQKIFGEHVTSMMYVDTKGNVVKQTEGFDEEIFNTDVATESKKADASARELPVFVCRTDDGATKYILPMSGAGLWGPIWGYVAVDARGSEIYGAYFSHQSETPGLGAEIEKPEFQNEFVGKHLFKDGRFYPITVVKAGLHPTDDSDYVDGISGGTITSKGVGAMLDNCLRPYSRFLESLSAKQSAN